MSPLANWTALRDHDPAYEFDSTDVHETRARSDADLDYLAGIVQRARIDPDCLQEMAEALGRDNAYSRLRRRRSRMRKSDFGEALVIAALREYDGIEVPIDKLRYQVEPDQVLPGTDAVGLRVTATGEIEELLVIEVKLRTTRDDAAAVEAYEQLASDKASGFSEALMFIADHMRVANRPLYDRLLAFLKRRTLDNDRFYVGLVWDTGDWRDHPLENLDAVDPRHPIVETRQVLLSELNDLVTQVSQRAGVTFTDD